MRLLDQDRESTHERSEERSIDVVDYVTGVASSCQPHGNRHDLGSPGADSVPDQGNVSSEECARAGSRHEC